LYKVEVKSLDGCFSSEIENQLVEAIKKLKTKSETFHPEAYHAVATESFRLAKNGYALTDRIKQEIGLDITIIPQDEEGILGFISAANDANVGDVHVHMENFRSSISSLCTL
jgi:exopolyphosphatase/guanosine-5'-triphosphate,3'-diphosphate pyrophosphatase